MTSVAAEFDHMEIQQQYNEGVNNRWDADDWDNENSSARLFERSRIKALAGELNELRYIQPFVIQVTADSHTPQQSRDSSEAFVMLIVLLGTSW